ncbi:MAG: tyrosine-type recombinase/integrase, partial [Methanobacteriota archaeon]
MSGTLKPYTIQKDLTVRTDKDLPPHITFEQFKKIYHGLAGKFKDQILCGLLWETGGRINDVMSLRWKDFDLDRQMLKLFVDKREDTINIPIGRDMTSDMKNYQSVTHPGKDDYLFPSKSMSGHVSRVAAYKKIRSWGVKFLGLDSKPPGNLHPHMFRHGLAIYLLYSADLQGGLEGRLKTIAARLGHKSVAIT